MKHTLFRLAALVLCLLALTSCAGIRHGEYHAFDDTKKNIGIYLDNPSDFLALEEQPDIYPWFQYWYGREADNKLMFCGRNPQITPFITWMPTDIPLDAIAAGQHDAYIRRFLENISKRCPNQDVLIRFAHEMEMRSIYGVNWYTWQKWGGEETYKEAWIHVITIGREVAPNVKWIWAPNRADEYSLPFYPGDEYVDYVGLTLNLASNKRFTYKYFEDFYSLEATKENLEAYGKKVIICEASFSSDDPELKANYLKTIFDYFKKDDNIAAIVFFNENKEVYRMFKISDNEEFMRVFIDGIRGLRNEETTE